VYAVNSSKSGGRPTSRADLATAVEADQLLPPPQRLISKTRTGAKVSRKHDTATTSFHRVISQPSMTPERIVALKRDLLADQSRRHPTPDSGVGDAAAHPGHQQSPNLRPCASHQARTFT